MRHEDHDKEGQEGPAAQELREGPADQDLRVPMQKDKAVAGSVLGGINNSTAVEAQPGLEEGPRRDGNHAHATKDVDTSVLRVLEGLETDRQMPLEEEMQLITNDCTSLICAPQRNETNGMTASEVVAYGKLKSFYSNIIKRLTAPLLRKVRASQLRPDAEPFTPKRTTRASKKSTATKRLRDTPMENVLLHALGMVPDDLEVDDDIVHEFKELFDSPLREQHVRIIMALFGKTIPSTEEMEAQNAVMVCA